MLKILVLGASGLLGHKLMQILSEDFDTVGTIRAREERLETLIPASRLIQGVSAEDFAGVRKAIETQRPDVVINSIGIIKQLPEASDPIKSIEVNALFPHRVAALCKQMRARFLQISTDCVFSGGKGDYTEDDPADCRDLYGLSKLMGEVDTESSLTIRTSIIGQHILDGPSLIQWFLRQDGAVPGFTKAMFSGLPTVYLCRTLKSLISNHPDLCGILHVSADPISKFDLLSLVKEAYSLSVEIVPDDSVACDRSLNSKRFRQATGIVFPGWPEMIEQMFLDGKTYSELQQRYLIAH